MKEWIIAGWIHLAVGFAIGWIVFARPQWATSVINGVWSKIKSMIGLGG